MLVEVFQTEHGNGHVFAAHFFPVGDFLIENVFDLLCAESFYIVFLVQCQHVSVFYDGIVEEAYCFFEQEADNQQDYHTGGESAHGKHIPCDVINQSFHISIYLIYIYLLRIVVNEE